MKQVLENLKTGDISVENVPAPQVRPGFVLVRNHCSVISSGTEGGTVKLGKMSLIGKARARPEQTRKVMAVARTQGVATAYRAATRALDMPVVLGYCSAGEIIDVGSGVDDLKVGGRVACAGAGYANHAEVVSVPRNLCAPIPADLPLRGAAFTTLGAIALQSVRIADVRLGENVVVIGLGLVGLLAAQILRAAGCNVFGIDVDEERIRWATQQGYCAGAPTGEANLAEQVATFSNGVGADAAIITAGTQDNAPIALAGEIVRTKGRVVVVGRTEMTAPRETYLFKELELRTSMAYGPGTGDLSYEEDGIDYPISYVRWTENRNMVAFLSLIADGRVDVEGLTTHEFPIEQAQDAFDVITGKSERPGMAVMLRYPESATAARGSGRIALARATTMRHAGPLGIGVIGAGSHATNELIPLLAHSSGAQLRGIASATGVRAHALGKKYGFAFCGETAEEVIADADTDCIYILTRHDTHAALAVAALAAGKHVFVEKPLALTRAELEQVAEAQRDSGRLVMVGFNRRYAPMALRLKRFFADRAQPMSLCYRANVGYRPPEHWLHDRQAGGGIILGEVCHFIDFCHWLTEAELLDFAVSALDGTGTRLISDDNLHLTLRFSEGSVATITYVSNGSTAYARERIEAHCDGRSAAVTDFTRLELAQGVRNQRHRAWLSADMGHRAQAGAFIAAATGKEEAALAVNSYFRASESSIAISEGYFGRCEELEEVDPLRTAIGEPA